MTETTMCVCNVDGFPCGCWFLQLIALYPGLMPSNSSFTRAVPPLHDIADITQLCHTDNVKVQQCKKFLLDYLRHITSIRSSADFLPPVCCQFFCGNRHLMYLFDLLPPPPKVMGGYVFASIGISNLSTIVTKLCQSYPWPRVRGG